MDAKRALQVEKEIAKVLGFKRVGFSGSKWYDKEDIREEINVETGKVGRFLIQVKATESTAVKLALRDINLLVSNAKKYHKKPIFVTHFDRKDTRYATWCSVPLEHFMKMKQAYEDALENKEECKDDN